MKIQRSEVRMQKWWEHQAANQKQLRWNMTTQVNFLFHQLCVWCTCCGHISTIPVYYLTLRWRSTGGGACTPARTTPVRRMMGWCLTLLTFQGTKEAWLQCNRTQCEWCRVETLNWLERRDKLIYHYLDFKDWTNWIVQLPHQSEFL